MLHKFEEVTVPHPLQEKQRWRNRNVRWGRLRKTEGIVKEQKDVILEGMCGTLWDGTCCIETNDTCGPDRCCGHSYRLSERQRQCEKLICPTYSSWVETEEGGRKSGMMLGTILEDSKPNYLFFFFCALHHTNVFWCGCVPVTVLASCSANMQRFLVAFPLTSNHWVLILQTYKYKDFFPPKHTHATLKARAMRLSLAHLTLCGTVWPSRALYLLPSYLNEVGRGAGPWRSQQNGNQRTLINALKLHTRTTEEFCRFSTLTPRNILMTKKDLWRFMLQATLGLKFMLFSAAHLMHCSDHHSPAGWD